MTNNLKMLLFSGGQTEVGKPYYHYAFDFLTNYLAGYKNKNVLFIPWAIWNDHGAADMFRFGQEHWGQFGLTLNGLHNAPDYRKAIAKAEAIIVGGGSTHLLVNQLAKNNLFPTLKNKIESGCLYMGTSAGAIIPGPGIYTALEPPIVKLLRYETLGVIPFQINTHYYDHDPEEFHHGPAPIVRVKNYLLLNPDPKPVCCLRDGSFLHFENNEITVRGTTFATLFDLNLARHDFKSGEKLII